MTHGGTRSFCGGLQSKSSVIGPFLSEHVSQSWLLFLNGRKSLRVKFSAETPYVRFSHQRTLQGKDGRWSGLLQRLHAVSPPAPPEAVHLPLLQVEPRAKQRGVLPALPLAFIWTLLHTHIHTHVHYMTLLSTCVSAPLVHICTTILPSSNQ